MGLFCHFCKSGRAVTLATAETHLQLSPRRLSVHREHAIHRAHPRQLCPARPRNAAQLTLSVLRSTPAPPRRGFPFSAILAPCHKVGKVNESKFLGRPRPNPIPLPRSPSPSRGS